MNILYEVAFYGSTVIAIAIVPLLTVYYRVVTVERRAEEIRIRLWDDEAIHAYLTLFTPCEPPPRKPEPGARRGRAARANGDAKGEQDDLDERVRQEFFGVHDWRRYGLGIGMLTFVTALTVLLAVTWADDQMRGRTTPIAHIGSTYIMALAGAYVWSVFEMLSRIRSRNLTPDDLIEMVLRYIAAVPIGYAFALLSLEQTKDAFAFIAAAFPLREARLLFRERALKKLESQVTAAGSRVTDGRIGKTIDGIGDATVATLEDAGYETYMDLAYADPIRVMAGMGHPLRLVLAWMDECLLAVYAPALKGPLAKAGIPCALDASEFFENYCVRESGTKADNAARVAALAQAVATPAPLLMDIFERVHGDPHVRFLARVWDTNAEMVNEHVSGKGHAHGDDQTPLKATGAGVASVSLDVDLQ
jgi:hypothetical protein